MGFVLFEGRHESSICDPEYTSCTQGKKNIEYGNMVNSMFQSGCSSVRGLLQLILGRALQDDDCVKRPATAGNRPHSRPDLPIGRLIAHKAEEGESTVPCVERSVVQIHPPRPLPISFEEVLQRKSVLRYRIQYIQKPWGFCQSI